MSPTVPTHGSQPALSAGAEALLPEVEDLARHIITFDATDRRTFAPFSLPSVGALAAVARHPIDWPDGHAPVPKPLAHPPRPDAPLPPCDTVVVTWTVEEARCLADTLTPGHASKTDWYPYTHEFESTYVPLIRHGAPALASKRLASWFPATIAGKPVMCLKSELHMSQDGPKLPVALLWRQIIAETGCKLIITTGTAGGIGEAVELGDVVVAETVRFDCLGRFKASPFHDAAYRCPQLKHGSLPAAAKLFEANLDHLPPAQRAPAIFSRKASGKPDPVVVTTDFFAFDDSNDTFKLQGLGGTVEMGDAVLGMVIDEMGAAAPKWAAVRNASDPQIDAAGLSEKEAARKAAQIYERYGYWTTIPSAIVCWALVLDN